MRTMRLHIAGPPQPDADAREQARRIFFIKVTTMHAAEPLVIQVRTMLRRPRVQSR